MTIDDVKAFLSEHKDDVEVKAFYAEISPEHSTTPDEVNEFLKTDEGKMIVQPMVDQAVTKAVKTRDKAHEVILENEVKKRVAGEVLKMNPQEEPWQKEIRELKEENEKERTERARDNLKRQLVEKAAAAGINPFFIDDYVPASLEVGELFLQKIKSYNDELTKKVTNELVAKGFKPGSAVEKNNSQKMDLSKLTQAELIRLELDGALDQQIEG